MGHRVPTGAKNSSGRRRKKNTKKTSYHKDWELGHGGNYMSFLMKLAVYISSKGPHYKAMTANRA